MSGCYISMKDVELNYPSAVYNSTTLKQEIFARLSKKARTPKLPDVQALRGFSAEIREGERVGVIGSNGSGKSTLLKALAGLYPIAGGTMEVQGEVRALLDMTLGFDPLSTGRENILYRGLMLGYTPESIFEIEDEIADFADIGEFLDYPVSSYSSGMMIRLAFAISTSIQGEILLVDEVLSTGDASFQEKAKQRMINTIDRAKILVLVLHDMQSISEICNRVILMKKGRIIADGDPDEVIELYMSADYWSEKVETSSNFN
jgi:lipopolysaccharide transport system ATP-binding protein